MGPSPFPVYHPLALPELKGKLGLDPETQNLLQATFLLLTTPILLWPVTVGSASIMDPFKLPLSC